MRGTHPDKTLFNLGLAISGATLAPNQTRTIRDIAAFITAAGAPVSSQAISHIEQRALRKLRVKLQFEKDPVLKELVDEFFQK
jgi:hypothetical protein